MNENDQFAALINAGIAGLQDAPFGTLLRRPQGFSCQLARLMVSPGGTSLTQRKSWRPKRRSPHRNLSRRAPLGR